MTTRIQASILAALWCVAALPVALFFSFVLSAAAITSVNAMPRWVFSSNLVGLSVNIAPPLIAGMIVYRSAILWLRRRNWFHAGLSSHLIRAWLLHGFAALCATVIVRSWSSPDFALWAQIPLWAGLSSFTGACTDAFFGVIRRFKGLD